MRVLPRLAVRDRATRGELGSPERVQQLHALARTIGAATEPGGRPTRAHVRLVLVEVERARRHEREREQPARGEAHGSRARRRVAATWRAAADGIRRR